MNLALGTIHTMRIGEKVNNGYSLTKGTFQITLPIEHSDEKLVEGENVDVFLFKDRQEKVVASTLIPKIVIGIYDWAKVVRSEEHTSELQSRGHLVCRLL